MPFLIQPGTEGDVREMAEVMVAALREDPCWQGMKGSWTPQQEYEFTLETLRSSMVGGLGTGEYQCWKAIDENGKILAWAGLAAPDSPTKQQKKSEPSMYRIPPGRNQKILDFFRRSVFPCLPNHSYDSTKHFQRQNIMVRPECQRQGLGRLLTEKCNAVADAVGAATYARAQPGAAALFVQMGFEILERIEIDLNELGAEGGKTGIYFLRREPGAKDQVGRQL